MGAEENCMAPIRVGVVGVGEWGEKHLQILTTLENVHVSAICDSDRNRVREIAKRYEVKHFYHDFHVMLEKEDLDAVHVVTPEKQHKEPTIEAAKLGLHVLVEKPIATTIEDADEMINIARKNNVFLMVGHVLRWDTRYAMVKDAIQRGEVGEIGAILARRAFSRVGALRYLPHVTPIMQSAIHDIDLILWYTKDLVNECYAYSSRLLAYPNPDTTVCILSLKKGAKAVLVNSFSLPERTPFLTGARMEIIGSKSFVIVDVTEQCLFFCDQNGWRVPDTTLIPMIRNSVVGTLKEEISYFIRCVTTGEYPQIISPEEAREAVRIALSCEQSLVEGRPVKLA
jgi:UDP-N-acetylglucosamine 3-dehydrogenase